MCVSSPRIQKGRFYAKFHADLYANSKASSLFWLIFNGNFHARFKAKLFISAHNIYDIKRSPRVAVHSQCSTNGLFINGLFNKCTNDCILYKQLCL